MTLGEVKDVRRSRKITNAENGIPVTVNLDAVTVKRIPVLGITGTGGAGKSSVTDEIVRRFLHTYADKTIAVISVDPSKKKNRWRPLGRPYTHECHLFAPGLYAQPGHQGKR